MSNPPEIPLNENQPLFLTADSAGAEYPGQGPDEVPDLSRYDLEEADPEPGISLKPRHKEVARLHALGKTNNQICKQLGYSVSRVSILLGKPAIRAEVDRYRNKLFDRDLIGAMQDLGGDALRVMEEIIRNPGEKSALRAEQARWLLEKLTGKPRQEVSVESNSLAAFTKVLKEMRDAGEVIDVTPGAGGEGEARPLAAHPALGAPYDMENGADPSERFANWIDTELK